MRIDNTTASDWVDSEDVLKMTDGENSQVFYEHRQIGEDGNLSPAYPPGATPENSTLISPYQITLTAGDQVVADGTDSAAIELSTDASQTREVALLVDSEAIGSYQVAPTDTIREQVTTTVSTRDIAVRAVGSGVFQEEVSISTVKP
jgi:hypothetical protein